MHCEFFIFEHERSRCNATKESGNGTARKNFLNRGTTR
nr:MAG TPA: hypothetical protein [Caudoviricetes sp.]